MTDRALVLVAHGTSDAQGQQTVRLLRAQVQRRMPGVRVLDAYVDVQHPRLDDVVAQLVGEGVRTVVVPLLLSTGYHMEVDVARAAERSTLVTAAPPLGPHPLLADILHDRLIEAGAGPTDPVVLAAAGSSRPEAAVSVRAVAEQLGARWVGQVIAGFASAATPSVPDAIAEVTGSGEPVHVAAYLIGRGFFHTSLQRQGVPVTEPIGADPRVTDLVCERYAAVADTAAWTAARSA